MMIRNVEISNFKGIKRCKIADLSLINIFIGRNNSGKSTVLDAIHWACKEMRGAALRDSLTRRVRREVGRSELFYGYSDEVIPKVALIFDGDREYSFELNIVREPTELKRPRGELISLHPLRYSLIFERKVRESIEKCYLYDVDPRLQHTTISPYPPEPPIPLIDKEVLEYAERCQFLPSHVRLDELWDHLDKALGEIKRKPVLEEDFTRRMGEVYGVSAYEYVPMSEMPDQRRVAFTEERLRIFGDFQGAGVQRGGLILSLLELLHNTAMFIEEIETYQHPEALRTLIKHTIELSEKNNVQLFVTTHSYYDALRFFIHLCEKKDALRCYLLKRTEGIVEIERIEDKVDKILHEMYGIP
jgi:energy-coupling factor transporter ATP-binding protein EcfA2